MLSHLLRTSKKTIGRARLLRKAQFTIAERLLWEELRGRRCNGIKFRRQVPLEPFIADFLCAEAHLVIELDGESHKGREAYDARRTKFLAQHDFRVMRFRNDDVIEDIDTVLKRIVAEVEKWRKQFEQ
ncbi:MAG TPA: DUF559 domain-containing protein [Candidatus Peribacterales bacterium]|nr:DUF559 domain-containing protein [Candidatus Peribacterales bacterium]